MVDAIVAAFASVQDKIDTRKVRGVTSNKALAELRPGLLELGFQVEAGKATAEKIRRPVLFGEAGHEDLAYEVDAFHPGHGIGFEVEAGRAIAGNAVYRDLIQTSLLVDARYLVLAVALEYHFKAGKRAAVGRDYEQARNLLDAIYASQRLKLPLQGILLIGY